MDAATKRLHKCVVKLMARCKALMPGGTWDPTSLYVLSVDVATKTEGPDDAETAVRHERSAKPPPPRSEPPPGLKFGPENAPGFRIRFNTGGGDSLMCRKYWPPTRPRYDKLRILYSDAAGLLYHHYYYDYHYYYYYYYYYYHHYYY